MKNYFNKRNQFICPKCGHPIKIYSFWKWLFMPHLFDTWRYIKCPVCSERSWMKRVNTTTKSNKYKDDEYTFEVGM